MGGSPLRLPLRACLARARKAIKTEIYFGEDEPGRKHVSPKAWQAFLSDVVTPRFRRA